MLIQRIIWMLCICVCGFVLFRFFVVVDFVFVFVLIIKLKIEKSFDLQYKFIYKIFIPNTIQIDCEQKRKIKRKIEKHTKI